MSFSIEGQKTVNVAGETVPQPYFCNISSTPGEAFQCIPTVDSGMPKSQKCILGPESSYLQIGIQEFPYFVGNTKCCINVNLEMCDQTEVFLCTQR